MNRRELLKLITAATGTAMVGGTAALAGCATGSREAQPPTYTFTEEDVRLLDEVAETILPRTDTPGAKDARVGAFMKVFVTDCYTPQEQALFHGGLPQLEASAEARYGQRFMALDTAQRTELIRELDREAKAVLAASGRLHYFTLIKQLTLFGFFTSEVGGTEVLRYVAIPGRYDGCMPYEEGERAWATR
ncbi:gluconate 2-dehydrogenase subunit 3 family protein [Marinimicrobium locisalis]|uniref:gluconate 2-dehydrogenase subunit 3 family protein n=1 Tax=Marinimicrobium locisalis TaxID=546022 RepID=UPI003221A6EA